MFSYVFFVLIIHQYLLCSRALRKPTRKHLHLGLIFIFFIFQAIYGVLWVLMVTANACVITVVFNVFSHRRKDTHKHYSWYAHGSTRAAFVPYCKHLSLFDQCPFAVQTHEFLRTLLRAQFLSHIENMFRCFISFRLRCKRMRFYVVFADTCIL